MIKPKADILFELSWEVCNKVGGIYTVVKSKAALTKENYKDYFLIGPYFEEKAKLDLEEKKPPPEIRSAFDKLEKSGIRCHFGRWQIKGEPKAILVESGSLVPKKDELKRYYWDNFKIDSIKSGFLKSLQGNTRARGL